jgi:hypothetical protein
MRREALPQVMLRERGEVGVSTRECPVDERI